MDNFSLNCVSLRIILELIRLERILFLTCSKEAEKSRALTFLCKCCTRHWTDHRMVNTITGKVISIWISICSYYLVGLPRDLLTCHIRHRFISSCFLTDNKSVSQKLTMIRVFIIIRWIYAETLVCKVFKIPEPDLFVLSSCDCVHTCLGWRKPRQHLVWN